MLENENNLKIFQKGLFSENKEKLILIALTTLRDFDDTNVPSEVIEQQFHALRRLVASKAGFLAFTTLPRYNYYRFTSIKLL